MPRVGQGQPPGGVGGGHKAGSRRRGLSRSRRRADVSCIEFVASDPLAAESRVMSAACVSVASASRHLLSSGISYIYFACHQLSRSVSHMLPRVALSPQEGSVPSVLWTQPLKPHNASNR